MLVLSWFLSLPTSKWFSVTLVTKFVTNLVLLSPSCLRAVVTQVMEERGNSASCLLVRPPSPDGHSARKGHRLGSWIEASLEDHVTHKLRWSLES